MDATIRPPRVEGALCYEIDSWFGDGLITSYPRCVVTEKLAALLAGSGLGCFEIRSVEIVDMRGVEEYDPETHK